MRDPGRDRVPFVGWQDERQHVEIPRTVEALRVGVDVVGDAAVANGALDQFDAVGECRTGGALQFGVKARPVRARAARPGQQFVVARGSRRRIGEKIRLHGPIRWAGQARL